ncbi:hypothetical protein BN2475_270013 [Paraburkholderia ribeironis]|uniref:Uncharacterized protein n=1 Tax=Paraburkholderia ribeironis TaxID=1247936 RepID=A0A1N7RZT8_9BURK|nr:hypothetical protein [Paraburkholderia ribeironis]SIT40625.1 hypothetical protein BN2475_270013 [Paraburkholderia ribeironis]
MTVSSVTSSRCERRSLDAALKAINETFGPVGLREYVNDGEGN